MLAKPGTVPGTRQLLIIISQLCLWGEFCFHDNFVTFASPVLVPRHVLWGKKAVESSKSAVQRELQSHVSAAQLMFMKNGIYSWAFSRVAYFNNAKQITQKYQHTHTHPLKKYLLLILREVDWTVERMLKWKATSEISLHAQKHFSVLLALFLLIWRLLAAPVCVTEWGNATVWWAEYRWLSPWWTFVDSKWIIAWEYQEMPFTYLTWRNCIQWINYLSFVPVMQTEHLFRGWGCPDFLLNLWLQKWI